MLHVRSLTGDSQDLLASLPFIRPSIWRLSSEETLRFYPTKIEFHHPRLTLASRLGQGRKKDPRAQTCPNVPPQRSSDVRSGRESHSREAKRERERESSTCFSRGKSTCETTTQKATRREDRGKVKRENRAFDRKTCCWWASNPPLLHPLLNFPSNPLSRRSLALFLSRRP